MVSGGRHRELLTLNSQLLIATFLIGGSAVCIATLPLTRTYVPSNVVTLRSRIWQHLITNTLRTRRRRPGHLTFHYISQFECVISCLPPKRKQEERERAQLEQHGSQLNKKKGEELNSHSIVPARCPHLTVPALASLPPPQQIIRTPQP